MRIAFKCITFTFPFFLGAALLFVPAADLAASQNEGAPTVTARGNEGDGSIGAGDIVSVTVADASEWSGKFRVDGSGTIEMGGISKAIQAEGLTPDELAHSISHALIDAKQLRAPRVNVFIEEYHGRMVSVLGAVLKPASYPIQKRTTVLDALSMAGGALPGAGGTVTVVRGPASAEATGTSVGSSQIIDMSRITSGADMSGNVQVRNGDVLNVSTARVVYVVGAVIKPGGFTLADPSAGSSVVKALSLAEGFTPLANSRHALIIRQSTSETVRQEVPVDVEQILTGKSADIVLAPDDILYIPESGAKKTARAMGQVAMALVNGIAVYGVGYRIGTLQ